MAATGVHVKALDTLPVLQEIHTFFKDMYFICGTDFAKIHLYCELYGLTAAEIIEAVEVLYSIDNKLR